MKYVLASFLSVFVAGYVSAQAYKVVVPSSSGVAYTHLLYDPGLVPGHTHFGIDIMAKCGSAIYPLANGDVLRTKQNENGLGYAIMIRHPGIGRNGNDLYTIYLHMQERPSTNGKALVAGDPVYSGVSIGKIGATGFAEGCHTHFEIRNFYKPSTAGDGWYHEKSKSCATGALNIYGCGDLRNESWALSDWVNPITYLPGCNPTKEFCTIRSYGTIGWFPPVLNCREAQQWYLLKKDTQGDDYIIGIAGPGACDQIPAVCSED